MTNTLRTIEIRVGCPDSYCHSDWVTKRPSTWTPEEREHVRRLVKGLKEDVQT